MSRFITPKDVGQEKFDAAIYGVWKGEYYGGIATYYALYRCITSLGLSAVLISPEMKQEGKEERPFTHSDKFAEQHYEAITKDFSYYDLEKLNECCDTFVMGCDQIWNYGISRGFGKSFYLHFADDDKRLISYASSFGHAVSFTPYDEAKEIESLFRRFDFLSVRETGAVSVLKKEFGVDAVRVLDPVFLADPKIFDEITEESSHREEEKYLVSYILDPTPEIREALQYAAKKLNLKLINMLDGIQAKFENNKEKLNLENVVEGLETQDWLYYLKHSEFVITDSCHGASFALVFQRPFVCIGNRGRGLDRFESLTKLFQIEDRYILDPKKIMEDERLLTPMDYDKIQQIMESERERSWKWLKNALSYKKEIPEKIGQSKQTRRTGYMIQKLDQLKKTMIERELERGTTVYLPLFEPDWSVKIQKWETDHVLEEALKIPAYLADAEFNWEQIKDTLEKKENVLFVGTQSHVKKLYQRLGKEYENLTVVTILEKENILSKIWKRYLKEVHGRKEIAQIVFSLDDEKPIQVIYQDGEKYERKRDDDLFFKIADSNLAAHGRPAYKMRRDVMRNLGWILPGDTLAEQNWIITNGTGAEQLFEQYKEEFSAEKWEDFAREEFIICKDSSHGDLPKAERDHFKNLISKKTLKESWQLGKERKYDVGIYGPWMSSNYGSILTYYALCRTVESFGYDVLMIEKGKERYVQRKEAYTASRRFAYQNYTAISPVYDYVNQSKLNDHCETFLLGLNQVWNYGVAKGYGLGFYFDFVKEERKKVAYGASFAHAKSFIPPSKYTHIIKLMKQFDHIAVREQGGAKILKDEFHLDGTVVLDPVFLADPAVYEEQIRKVKKKETEKFMVSYILDPTPQLNEVLAEIKRKNRMESDPAVRRKWKWMEEDKKSD